MAKKDNEILGMSICKYLQTILNGIKQPIFAHDADFNIIFANEAYQKLAKSSLRSIEGQKYWMIYPKANGPSESCLSALKTKKEQKEEVKGPNNTTFINKSFPVVRDGKILFSVHILQEITAVKENEEALRNRLKLEKFIVKMTKDYANFSAEEADKFIQTSLASIGKFTEVERTCVALFSEEYTHIHTIFEWVDQAKGIKPLIKDLSDIPTHRYQWFMRNILHAGVFIMTDINELPPEAANEKQAWKRLGYQSMLLVPLLKHKKHIGFVCFDVFSHTKNWRKEDIELLHIITELISQALSNAESWKNIKARIDFEHFVANIAKYFAVDSPKKLDQAIQKTLQETGKFTGVDRTCVALLSEDQNYINTLFEWVDKKKGIAPLIKHLQNMPTKRYPWLMEHLLHDDMVMVPDVDQLPAKAATEKCAWQKIGYKAMLLVPLIQNDKKIGFVCFDVFREPRDWKDENFELLKIIAGLINQALERKHILNVLLKNEQQFETIFNETVDGVCVLDKEMLVLDWNKGAEDITGYTKSEVLHRYYLDVFYSSEEKIDTHTGLNHTEIQKIFLRHQTFDTSNHPVYMVRKDGQKIYVRLIAMPVFDSDRKFVGAVMLFSDITRQTIKEEALEYQANYDALTDLSNRRSLDRILKIECERSRRYGRHLSAMFIDIDDFKKFNDAYGHKEGDLVLVALGKLLKKQARISDYAFRYGGEEFLLLLPEADRDILERIAERLRQAFCKLKFKPKLEKQSIQKTVSIGIADFDPGMSDIDLITYADEAMYQAKKLGKNQVFYYKK